MFVNTCCLQFGLIRFYSAAPKVRQLPRMGSGPTLSWRVWGIPPRLGYLIHIHSSPPRTPPPSPSYSPVNGVEWVFGDVCRGCWRSAVRIAQRPLGLFLRVRPRDHRSNDSGIPTDEVRLTLMAAAFLCQALFELFCPARPYPDFS